MTDEIETLRAESLQCERELRMEENYLVADHVAALSAALARAQTDAERYRWLRENGNREADGIDIWCYYDGTHLQQGNELDAAIDAARKGEAK